jgi:16S rRNA (adenine1518-N6/adenine1519-N6)-dimethyltransferase
VASNQTYSFLRKRFQQAGIHPDTRHGQNFLIDLNLVRLLIEAAELSCHDVVLEVGTGTGSLTAMMAQTAGAVVTFEIDEQLFQLAGEELRSFDNVFMHRRDVLRNKNNLHSEVMEAIREQVAAEPGRQWKLAANLPYNIATPLISNLLVLEDAPVKMTVTIQKELADRITAAPNSKAYGALSVWVQSQCRAELVRVLPPTVFWPRPKVHSAIISIALDESLRARIPDRKFFQIFVRSIFLHRRKFLRSCLLSTVKGKLGKPEVDEILGQFGYGPDARAEQLDPDSLLALSEAVRARVGELSQ